MRWWVGGGPATVYASAMNETSTSSWGRRAVAALVLRVAAWILLKFVVGIAIAIASGVVLVAAVVALLWALNTLL